MSLGKEIKPWKPAATILRERLEDPNDIVICPGVYDGYTARIALAAGFDALYMTGAGSAASVLGAPDLALITLPEVAGNAGMIASMDRNVPVIGKVSDAVKETSMTRKMGLRLQTFLP
jgi:2-methylisocitrate lyase-like PEP mutase family enzyme